MNKIRKFEDLHIIDFYYRNILQEPYIITNGCFDIVHPDHVRYLKGAYDICKNVVLCINDDESIRKLKGENRPLFNIQDRMFFMSSIKYVSFIIPFGERLYDVFDNCKPTYWAKGPDYTLEKLDPKEREIAESKGIQIVFTKKDDRNEVTTSNIIETIKWGL